MLQAELDVAVSSSHHLCSIWIQLVFLEFSSKLLCSMRVNIFATNFCACVNPLCVMLFEFFFSSPFTVTALRVAENYVICS